MCTPRKKVYGSKIQILNWQIYFRHVRDNIVYDLQGMAVLCWGLSRTMLPCDIHCQYSRWNPPGVPSESGICTFGMNLSRQEVMQRKKHNQSKWNVHYFVKASIWPVQCQHSDVKMLWALKEISAQTIRRLDFIQSKLGPPNKLCNLQWIWNSDADQDFNSRHWTESYDRVVACYSETSLFYVNIHEDCKPVWLRER